MTEATPHPAKYSAEVIMELRNIILDEVGDERMDPYTILDPFAGVGGIHKLKEKYGWPSSVLTTGIELEPEWAEQHPDTLIGNALELPWNRPTFNCICTSPSYGNRLADSHNAQEGSKRITYTHYLGRKLTPTNSGMMQWTNPEYKLFHLAAWEEAYRVLLPGGLLIINCKNHIRDGEVMPVVEWHLSALLGMPMLIESVRQVKTPGMGFGANAEKRVPCEHVIVCRKP